MHEEGGQISQMHGRGTGEPRRSGCKAIGGSVRPASGPEKNARCLWMYMYLYKELGINVRSTAGRVSRLFACVEMTGANAQPRQRLKTLRSGVELTNLLVANRPR